MNAMLTATIPLPAILDQPSPMAPGRRHCIDNFHLTAASVDRFNALLAVWAAGALLWTATGSQRPHVNCATAQREPASQPASCNA
jgi:hypothetical protein